MGPMLVNPIMGQSIVFCFVGHWYYFPPKTYKFTIDLFLPTIKISNILASDLGLREISKVGGSKYLEHWSFE